MKTREEKLEYALRLLLDQIDFRKGACTLMEPIGALVPKEVWAICDEALEPTP